MLIIWALTANVAFCQSDNNAPCHTVIDSLTNIEVVRVLETHPTVEGGNAALYKAVSKNVKYPHLGEFPIESKVIVAFIVDKDGQVSGKRIIKSIQGTDLAEQLLDILDDLKWRPGVCHGKAVSSLMIFPMTLEWRK